MKRILILVLCLVLVSGLCISASAAADVRASSVNFFATVSADGSSQITVTLTLHLDTPQEKLTFPIPANATNITLNGSHVITEKTGQTRQVNLAKALGGMAGDFSLTVAYSLHAATELIPAETTAETGPTESSQAGKVRLELPMLSGFAHPIEQLQFSVNLPGIVTQAPSFLSGYHQADIEQYLNCSISGGNIAGRSQTSMKDHETLTLYLDTTEEMFPQTRVNLPDMEGIPMLIGICVGIAMIFWVLFLWNILPPHSYPPIAPEGISAGQLGSVLTMAGPDLNLMAFSWAQLGYVVLRMDRRGRVLILKRMDMGNERTAFEQKCFYNLFSRRDLVDTSGMAYIRMCQAVSRQRAATQLFKHRKGLPVLIFRVLMAIAGLLCGTCFGILLGNMLDFGWLFMLSLSAIGLVCSWHIQAWPQGMFLHHHSRLWIAAGLCVLWLALGIAIGQFPLALLAVVIQVAAGFLAAFGGRRSEEGRTAMGQTLSLRHHLKHLSRQEIQQLCRNNPEFFFDMAPDALALGCDASFARRFGKSRLPVCPYIQVSDTRGMTALQWSQLMRQILDGMTARQRKLPLESLRAVMGNYMK